MPNILPGPWYLEYDGERDSYMVYDAPPNEDGEVFMTIAEVHVGERASSQCHQPSHARLIAAAPELLDACREAVSAITYLLSNDDDDPNYADTLNTLAAAITKAEGRSE